MLSTNNCTLPPQFLLPRFPHSIPRCPLTVISASFRRRSRSRSRRRHNKPKLTTTTTTTSSENKLETVIDLDSLTTRASTTFRTLFPNFDSHFRRFISSGKEAYIDLQTLVTLDGNRRIVVSCRPSTLHFVGTSAVLTFVAILVFRVFVKLVSGFSSCRRNASRYTPMVRRDRSLGGREVVVGLGNGDRERSVAKVSTNPLSTVQAIAMGNLKSTTKNKVDGKLPKWWPTTVKGAVSTVSEQEEYKRLAYKVVRAIEDTRMSGKDIMDSDIIQLRQLCRISGVQVSIEPTNIRDSLYRASVNFVLSVCSRAQTYSTAIDVNGEDPQQFLSGFADNIGLENGRAATIVSAAVAARTRSCLLQAWALEMQGKHVDASAELSKICLLLQIFPPEHYSPEMEMVRRGLEKHLKLEQRKHLMFLFGKVCCQDSHWIAREALGLLHSQDCCRDQPEDNIV